MAEYVEEGTEGKAWVEQWLTPLASAVAAACTWLADRYEEREALANDLEEIEEALVAAIQMWQDFESTEPLATKNSNGTSLPEWLGARRTSELHKLDARIDRNYRDAVKLAGLPVPQSHDHVLLDAAQHCLKNQPEDPGGYAARVAIRRLNDKITQVRLLAQGLVAV